MLLLTVLLALQSPVFTLEMWPGEGVPRFVANKASLELYSEASRGAAKHRLATRSGAPIDFDRTKYITVRAGRIVARKRGTTSGRVFGKIGSLSKELYYADKVPTRAVAYAARDTLEFLQDRAEGTCIMRIRGEVVESDPCPGSDKEAFTTLDEPHIEWWIRVAVGKTMDRFGRPLTMKLRGTVEPYFRHDPPAA